MWPLRIAPSVRYQMRISSDTGELAGQKKKPCASECEWPAPDPTSFMSPRTSGPTGKETRACPRLPPQTIRFVPRVPRQRWRCEGNGRFADCARALPFGSVFSPNTLYRGGVGQGGTPYRRGALSRRAVYIHIRATAPAGQRAMLLARDSEGKRRNGLKELETAAFPCPFLGASVRSS
jgi:hypothetical protein